MTRTDTPLAGLCVVEPKIHGDPRGFFLETYNRRALEAVGIPTAFVQDNLSRSRRGVVRGLHWQAGRPQAKLVSVLAGEVYDAAVDLRRGSPTFGKWWAGRLDSTTRKMLYIPEGFAHGFCVLSETADFFYKCSDFYSPPDERGLLWNDPALAIPWPLGGASPVVSARDAAWPTLERLCSSDLPR